MVNIAASLHKARGKTLPRSEVCAKKAAKARVCALKAGDLFGRRYRVFVCPTDAVYKKTEEIARGK